MAAQITLAVALIALVAVNAASATYGPYGMSPYGEAGKCE